MSDEANIIKHRVNVQIEPILLRRVDAARVLSISPRLFDDLVLAGLIGKVKIGGVVAFDLNDLRGFVLAAKQFKYDSATIRVMVEKAKRRRNSLQKDSSAESSSD